MATVKERVIEYLKAHPEGVDDDDLSQALGLSRRQQAGEACRKLQSEGLVRREAVDGKLHTFWQGAEVATPAPAQPQSATQGPERVASESALRLTVHSSRDYRRRLLRVRLSR